jgi:8-oxoguanine deaminase
MDEHSTELQNASILIRDGNIIAIGAQANLPQDADEIIDARGHLVVPGMINTHHHMYQSLTRAVPSVQNVCIQFGLA